MEIKKKFLWKKISSGPEKLQSFILTSIKNEKYEVSASFIRKQIFQGAAQVNSKATYNPALIVNQGDDITFLLDKSAVPQSNSAVTLDILYQDDEIICINKPAGIPAQTTLDEKRVNFYDFCKKTLQEQHGLTYLGLHHRLDRDTSGVMLFTLQQSANAAIAEQFKNHTIQKTYDAVVHGMVSKKTGDIVSFMAEVSRKGKQKKFGSVRSGGKKAITLYRVLKQNKFYTHLEVEIKTGRTHQIRVHLSEMGHPIVGDTLYGSPVGFFSRLQRYLLHARTLKLIHPRTRKAIIVSAPTPIMFSELLSQKMP